MGLAGDANWLAAVTQLSSDAPGLSISAFQCVTAISPAARRPGCTMLYVDDPALRDWDERKCAGSYTFKRQGAPQGSCWVRCAYDIMPCCASLQAPEVFLHPSKLVRTVTSDTLISASVGKLMEARLQEVASHPL